MNDRVDPADESHQLGRLHGQIAELFRRLAIYERRILILEGKRDPKLDPANWNDWVTDHGVVPVVNIANEDQLWAALLLAEVKHRRSPVLHPETETGQSHGETETGETETEPWKAAGVSKATYYRRQKRVP